MDDRVCMHYVVDRLESIIKLHDPENPEISDMKYMHKELEEFKRKCIYNLGVNTRIRYKEGDQ